MFKQFHALIYCFNKFEILQLEFFFFLIWQFHCMHLQKCYSNDLVTPPQKNTLWQFLKIGFWITSAQEFPILKTDYEKRASALYLLSAYHFWTDFIKNNSF